MCLLVNSIIIRLKGHDQNVSAYSRRSVNSGGVVNLTFTYVYTYVRTYVRSGRLLDSRPLQLDFDAVIIKYNYSIRGKYPEKRTCSQT